MRAWPWSFPITVSPSPSARAREANECLRSWIRTSSIPARSLWPGFSRPASASSGRFRSEKNRGVCWTGLAVTLATDQHVSLGH